MYVFAYKAPLVFQVLHVIFFKELGTQIRKA